MMTMMTMRAGALAVPDPAPRQPTAPTGKNAVET
jgi:hypothetical protein